MSAHLEQVSRVTDTRNASLPLCSALNSCGGVCSFQCVTFSVLSPPSHRESTRTEPLCELSGLTAGELGPVTCLRFVTVSLKSAGAKQLGFKKLAISKGEKSPCPAEAFPTSSVVTVFFFQELMCWQGCTTHTQSPRVASPCLHLPPLQLISSTIPHCCPSPL